MEDEVAETEASPYFERFDLLSDMLLESHKSNGSERTAQPSS
jgi:hypothetical protein